MYINDLHNAIKFSTVHYFADDTNLLVWKFMHQKKSTSNKPGPESIPVNGWKPTKYRLMTVKLKS